MARADEPQQVSGGDVPLTNRKRKTATDEQVSEDTTADLPQEVSDRLGFKKQSEDFQLKYGMSGPEGVAPQEKGVQEDSFIPNNEEELRKHGWAVGAVPFGPGGATAAEDSDVVGPIIQRLFGTGMKEGKIAEAAENVRIAGSHTFVGPNGRAVYTAGEHSPLGQELKAYGRARTNQKWLDTQAGKK